MNESQQQISFDNDLFESVSKELARIEEDAEYSSKGHYNAAGRWQWAHLGLGLPNAILAGFAGINAFKGNDLWAGSLAICAAAIAAALTFLNPGDRSSAHKRSAGEYHTLRNRSRIFRTIVLGTLTEPKEITARFEELSQRRDELNATCPQIPSWAFKAARRGIEEGESRHRVDQ